MKARGGVRRVGEFLLPTEFAGARFRNPVLAASGTAGHGAELAGMIQLDRLGAIVSKSMFHEPWPGNPAPRLAETPAGMINAVGLQGPGVRHWVDHDLPQLLEAGATVVASIWGRSVEEYALAARQLSGVRGVEALEINLSCPNLEGRDTIFAHDADLTGRVVEACRVAGLPLWAKLSANTDRVVAIAAAAREAGASAVTLINTLLGLVLDPIHQKPVLGKGGGGLSGPAIAPVALRTVWDVHAAFPDLPIVGAGGVTSAAGVRAMMSAGAGLVQLGSSSFVGPRILTRTVRDLERLARREGVGVWSELVGSGHDRARS